jgi:hypothetical protein
MSKSFFFKFGFMLVLVAVAVFWLLSFAFPGEFGDTVMQWVMAGAVGAIGLFYVLRSFSKELAMLRKFYLFFGMGLIAVGGVLVINILAVEDETLKRFIIPGIAVVAAVALLLSVVITGGKKWDQGDNKVIGYKNYAQRKAEAERLAEKENKK